MHMPQKDLKEWVICYPERLFGNVRGMVILGRVAAHKNQVKQILMAFSMCWIQGIGSLKQFFLNEGSQDT